MKNKMFDGRKINPVLDYYSSKKNEESAEIFAENRKRISISGVQEKLSMVTDGNRLRLTEPGEQGRYILKPIPSDVKNADQVPANEHLTMQIAKLVYKINTAENSLVFFKDGTPAYLTKRFDFRPDGKKWGKEDFASLAGRTSENAGSNYKYDLSYEELGGLIKYFVPAWRVEIEKYFRIVLFNYVFSNGDAHLKNFALLESPTGDYMLSPFYDLLDTRLHVNDSDLALTKGLFSDDFKSDQYKRTGHPALTDYTELGKRIGVNPKRIEKIIEPLIIKQEAVDIMITSSILNEKSKKAYRLHYYKKLNYLNGKNYEYNSLTR